MAPERFQQTFHHFADDAELKSKLERMKAKLSQNTSNLKPVVQPKAAKKSVVCKLAKILGKHHGSTVTARPITMPKIAEPKPVDQTSEKPTKRKYTKRSKVNDFNQQPPKRNYTICRAQSTRYESDSSSDTNTSLPSSHQLFPTPSNSPTLIEISGSDQEHSTPSHQQEWSDNSNDSAQSIVSESSSISSPSREAPQQSSTNKRPRETEDLYAHWIVKRDAANRRNIDAFCFCGYVRSHEHMIKCRQSEICIGITTNWFHASCVGVSERRLKRLVRKDKEFVCGACKANKQKRM